MLIETLRNPIGHDALSSTSERFRTLEQLAGNQMAMIGEALTIANVLLKLAAMDASLTAYISAAETTPDLVQRLFIAQTAASKELELEKNVKRSELNFVSVDETSNRLKEAAREENLGVEKRVLSTARRDSRSSSKHAEPVTVQRRKAREGPVDIIRRTSTPAQLAPFRPRSKSPQISELPRLGGDLDSKPSQKKGVVEDSHFNLRCWGAVFNGIATHWVRSSPKPVRGQ